jgi:hypothetical protein
MDVWLSDGHEQSRERPRYLTRLSKRTTENLYEVWGMSLRGGVCRFGRETRSSKATY